MTEIKKYTVKKADNLIKFLEDKKAIKFEYHPTNADNIIIHLPKNRNGDELFWFGTNYGMYANKI